MLPVDGRRPVWTTGRTSSDGWCPVYRNGQLTLYLGPSEVHGRGVFAARRFAAGETIGQYDGSVVRRFETREQADAYCDGLQHPSTMLLLRRDRARRQYVLVDGARGRRRAPLQFCNDPRGTRKTANARMTLDGGLRTTRPIPAYPARTSEILWRYGASYWREAGRRKTRHVGACHVGGK